MIKDNIFSFLTVKIPFKQFKFKLDTLDVKNVKDGIIYIEVETFEPQNKTFTYQKKKK